jgi:hypothetical protein
MATATIVNLLIAGAAGTVSPNLSVGEQRKDAIFDIAPKRPIRCPGDRHHRREGTFWLRLASPGHFGSSEFHKLAVATPRVSPNTPSL